MKKALCILFCVVFCFCFVACNNKNGTTDGGLFDDSPTETDYASKIVFPEMTGTYEYYSYGYHWSTVTVSDYEYEISEQSKTQIRIDFDFNCTFDYHGENAAGLSFSFYIFVYDQDGALMKKSIVNENSAQVGDTVVTEYTLLLDKEDVQNGVVIEFGGNK